MATSRCKRAFTLIELLVVIAIIAILMSIMLPSLRMARVQLRLTMCQMNMRAVTNGLLAYVSNHRRQLPWTQSRANPSTCRIIGYSDKITGFGCLYAGKYVVAPGLFFCPDGAEPEPTTGWGGAPEVTRQRFIDEFDDLFYEPSGMRVDYVLGWWTQTSEEYPERPDWAWPTWDPRSPSTLRDGATLENYMESRLIWMADEYGAFPYSYWRATWHNNNEFQNVARVDGSATYIRNYRDKLPGDAYYYPYNDRPDWGWWAYFGAELE